MKDPKEYAKEKFLKKAEQVLDDPAKVEDLIGKAKEKLHKEADALGDVLEDLMCFFRLVKSYISGEYKEVQTQSIIYIVLAIIYYVVPTDLVPDFFPIVGYLDDITVIGWVMSHVKGEVESFKQFESQSA